jgi:hypothetical protein
MVAILCVPLLSALRRLRQEDGSSRSVWAASEAPISKTQKQKNILLPHIQLWGILTHLFLDKYLSNRDAENIYESE